METTKINEILDEVIVNFNAQLALRRSITLDIFEALLDGSPHWPMLRKKRLGLFGESGLEGDFFSIMQKVQLNLSKDDNHEAI